jgi:hypothetical protein
MSITNKSGKGDTEQVEEVDVLDEALAEIDRLAKHHLQESRNKEWSEWVRDRHYGLYSAYIQSARMFRAAITKVHSGGRS